MSKSAFHRVGECCNHRDIRLRRFVGLYTALLPVAQRADWDVIKVCELVLCKTKAPPQSLKSAT